MHVPGELRVVGKYRVAADLAVVGEMDIRHEPVVVADPRHANVLRGPAIEGAELADGVAVADFPPRRRPLVLLVLGNLADGGELEDAVALADARVAGHHGMRADPAPRSDL